MNFTVRHMVQEEKALEKHGIYAGMPMCVGFSSEKEPVEVFLALAESFYAVATNTPTTLQLSDIRKKLWPQQTWYQRITNEAYEPQRLLITEIRKHYVPIDAWNDNAPGAYAMNVLGFVLKYDKLDQVQEILGRKLL